MSAAAPRLTIPMPDDSQPAGALHRRSMPPTRDAITHKFSINGHEAYLTIGLFKDRMPGEVFIKMAKEGSTISGLMQGYCRAFSLALQYGLPLDEAVRRFKGMRFEPMGHIDYIALYLKLHFLDTPPGSSMPS
jgi:ribonucleoside-diphosphate reductase alpha chain